MTLERMREMMKLLKGRKGQLKNQYMQRNEKSTISTRNLLSWDDMDKINYGAVSRLFQMLFMNEEGHFCALVLIFHNIIKKQE